MVTPLLSIEDIHVDVDGNQVIKGLSMEIRKGEVHAIMGRNGAGKSTLAHVLMGHPDYEVTSGSVRFLGRLLEELEVWVRARAVMFLSFQYPQAILGVQVGTFLRKSVLAVGGDDAPSNKELRMEMKKAMEALGVDRSFLARYVNDGFSGGEKKRLEILQMLLLTPELAILDETDSGLDIDTLRTVATGINSVAENSGCLVITHYQRLLDYLKPTHVHVMIDGAIVMTGGPELALEVEEKGYDWLQPTGTTGVLP
jgi:Fe-S cluster assembly ATP-binding protein